jgi:hypothetical protein
VLALLAPNAGQVYVIRSTPRLPFGGPGCLSRKHDTPILRLLPEPECTAPGADRRNDEVWDWLSTVAKPYANVQLLDLNDAVCPQGMCSAELGEQIVFRDSNHLTASFASALGPVLAERIVPHQ